MRILMPDAGFATSNRIGDFPVRQPLLENGEVRAGTMSESQEIVLLQTFARRIRATRQMLVNDDLGAFTDFAAMIGRRVADFGNAAAQALVRRACPDAPTLQGRWYPVKSETRSRFGRAGWNCRFANSAGHGLARSCAVVFAGLPRTTPASPVERISRSTVRRAAAMRPRRNWRQSLRTSWTPKLAPCTRRIAEVSSASRLARAGSRAASARQAASR